MTRILLIRHGETAWNAVRRLQGHIDIPLNEEGERQARALARALASEPVDAIVSSDLGRAVQTARAVAGHHPQVALHADPALRERCYGAFEGLLYSEIAERYPLEFAEWQARNVDAVMPAGERTAESFRQFYQRSMDGIAHWAAQYPRQSIVIVAHGGVLECAYRAARGQALDTPRDFTIRNATINRFRLEEGGALALESWGEAIHLDASLDEMM